MSLKCEKRMQRVKDKRRRSHQILTAEWLLVPLREEKKKMMQHVKVNYQIMTAGWMLVTLREEKRRMQPVKVAERMIILMICPD